MKSILILSTFFVLSAHAQSMSPGLWKATTKFKLNGIPLPGSEEQECISKSEAKDVKSTLTSALKKKGCDLTSWNLKGEKLEAKLNCKDGDLEATGVVKGTVTRKKYDLVGDAEGSFKGIPSQATVSLVGEWLQTCTK